MRHAPVSILAIVAIVGIATLMFSVSLLPEPAPFATVYVGKAASAQGGNTVIARLDVGEFISSEVESLTEAQLSGLRSGTVHGSEGSTTYIQTLRFNEPGVFNGGRATFGKSESSEVSDFLEFDDAIFKLHLEFGSGLQSMVESNRLPDIEDEDITILGDSYSIVDTEVDTSSNSISIKLFGGFGSIEFTDGNYADDNYYRGVKVNGRDVSARVKIKATDSGNRVTVYSIQYILDADSAIGGTVEVLPLHCVRESLQHPTGMLSPSFDICYKGFSGTPIPSAGSISGNEVRIRPSGDDEYVMTATNTRGQVYKIPLAQLPGLYGNKGRDFIFKEANNPASPNIDINDYFLVNSKNDISGSSHVLRYDRLEGNTAYFEDLSGSQRSVSMDPSTMEGTLLVGEGTYKFVVGAGDSLAMDQTNDNSISGGEARFVFAGGSRVDFGPGFTITITTPERLFDEATSDENTVFDITFGGGQVDLVVPSPQGSVFKLQSGEGRKQGLTQYGILFDWDTDSESDSLTLTIPGAYSGGSRGGAGAEVFISLERAKLMKPIQSPAPIARCGDGIITKPEYCDPAQSLCATPNAFERGVCSKDCLSCVPKPKSVCGNKLLEPGEQCEASADCAAGLVCQGCKCVLPPAPLCGNKLLEAGEQCESAADCPSGMACSGCKCLAPNCAVLGKCRVWNGCSQGSDSLMVDGVSQGCVDPLQAAMAGVPYCGAMPIARGSLACNYMDAGSKPSCVCPSSPVLELPAPVESPTAWQRFRAWLGRLFKGPSAVPALEVPSPVAALNCANAAPCRFWDASCGKGHEPLYVDGKFVQCVDPYEAAGKQIPYCAHKPKAQESAYCNYMSNDPREKLPCVCR